VGLAEVLPPLQAREEVVLVLVLLDVTGVVAVASTAFEVVGTVTLVVLFDGGVEVGALVQAARIMLITSNTLKTIFRFICFLQR